uniref:Mab-21 domain-containing protein n=1 Tax=Strongyloides papillosus TaxID=174720 RepID=A0A0N5BMH5_STREA
MIKDINPDDENLLDDNNNDVAKSTDIVGTKPDDPSKGNKDKHSNLPDPPLIKLINTYIKIIFYFTDPPLGEDKSKKRKSNSSVEEYAKKLETDNRTLESYFFLQLINQMPSKPMSFCSIMAFDSFKVYHKLMNAININLLESSMQKNVSLPLEVNKNVDFGIINKGNSLLRIYSLSAGNRYRGVKILVPAGAEFPSMRIPDWKELLIIYRGGTVSGNLPPKLEFLGLEGFKESINVNWKELFMGVTKLKVLLTVSCEVFKKLEKLIANMKTLQAVMCMNKQGCKCYSSPLRKTFIRELSIVPDHENNNTYFADVGRAKKARKPNPRFHYSAKIYYRNENILTKICSTELPSTIKEELKALSSKNPKTADE